MFITSSSCLCT